MMIKNKLIRLAKSNTKTLFPLIVQLTVFLLTLFILLTKTHGKVSVRESICVTQNNKTVCTNEEVANIHFGLFAAVADVTYFFSPNSPYVDKTATKKTLQQIKEKDKKELEAYQTRVSAANGKFPAFLRDALENTGKTKEKKERFLVLRNGPETFYRKYRYADCLKRDTKEGRAADSMTGGCDLYVIGTFTAIVVANILLSGLFVLLGLCARLLRVGLWSRKNKLVPILALLNVLSLVLLLFTVSGFSHSIQSQKGYYSKAFNNMLAFYETSHTGDLVFVSLVAQLAVMFAAWRLFNELPVEKKIEAKKMKTLLADNVYYKEFSTPTSSSQVRHT